jgi:Cu-Zn family superoxide dismutase
MRPSAGALAIVAAVALAAAGARAQEENEKLTAEVTTADGQSAGVVTFEQADHGVIVRADLMNLPEGPHGFHIHQTGACAPDFQAAGGHYAPQENEHGFDSEAGHHAGDLPNIHVAADGTAKAEFFAPHLTLSADRQTAEEPPFTVRDQDGSAIMVHGSADDYVSADSAGPRIACGVIASPQG